MARKNFYQHYFNWKLAKEEDPSFVASTIHHALGLWKKNDKPIEDLVVLDVGCGAGQFSLEIGKHVKKVIGIEPFREAYLLALDKKRKSNLRKKIIFRNIPIEEFKTKEEFDLVLCLTTLEHMPKAEMSFKRIFELLKDGGMIYLTVPNKFWPYEYHYQLFFLSWLPLKYANLYVRLMKRGKSFEDSAHALSYLGIKKFFDKFPCEYEFIVPNPEEKFLGLGDTGFFYNLMKNMGIWLLKKLPLFWFFSKAFIIVITKIETTEYL